MKLNRQENNPALNNIVDKDIQSMLRPLNLFQIISVAKYRIKNNYITPNNIIIYLFSIIAVLIFISLYIFRTYMLYTRKFGATKVITVNFFYDGVYYSFGFAMIFFIGVIHAEKSIKFVLVFQRVHRFLNNATSFNRFIIWNWVAVILIPCSFVIIYSCLIMQMSLPWYFLYVHYLLIIFDLNFFYAIQVMKLLENKLLLWSSKLLMDGMRCEDFSKRMFQAYVDILECYDLFKVCYQPFILYYTVEVFLHSIINIEITIELLKAGVRYNELRAPTINLIALLVWVGKDLMWQSVFMQRCEAFYVAIENVRDSCSITLKTNCSDSERKLCKNVLRLQRASFSKLRVCGLFHMDAALHLSLVSLLANYTIVLLQFAIL